MRAARYLGQQSKLARIPCGRFTIARVESAGKPLTLCAVSHVSRGKMAFVAASSSDTDSKQTLSLFTCSAGDVRVEAGEACDTGDVQVIGASARAATKFFSAAESPACALSVVRERELASVLVGARRVLLFDFRPAALDDAGASDEEVEEELTQ